MLPGAVRCIEPMDDETPDRGAAGEHTDEAAVRRANQDFYDAFETQDMDAMSDVWDHGEDVVCTHPGWETLHGWGAVAGSWYALFEAGAPLQFVVTNERVRIEGDLAWVTLEENLLEQSGRDVQGTTVAAVNLFRRRRDGWRMVLHHGSPVVAATPISWVQL